MQTGTDLLADTEDQAALRALAREVATRSLAPMASHWDETETFPQKSWEALTEAGLMGICIGEQWGGAGLGDVESTIVLEELARVDVASSLLFQITANGGPRSVEHLGNKAMQDRWLPPIAAGEALMSIGITEAEAGSAVPFMRAALRRDGTGYRLNAYKNYVTGGANSAACLVWCKFPDAGEGSGSIGAVVVDLTLPGVSVQGIHRKMGMRGMREAELVFDDVRIEAEDVLLPGSPESWRTLLKHLNHERCGNAAVCIGAAQGALEHATRYLQVRVTGRTRLADLQGLQWKLADMAIELEAARLLLYRAVALAPEHGTPPAMETTMAKAKANLVAKFVCDEALQLHGGYGYSREYPVERIYRDIRGMCLGAGTVEVQRNFIGGKIAGGVAPMSPAWNLSGR
jgi:alkylation response protein AidB-like acyl-CoA dehydrogenase